MRLQTPPGVARPKCCVCGAAAGQVLLTKDGLDVYQCPTCGLAFTYPQPDFLAEQYDDSYFDLYRKRREFRLRRSDARLSRIEVIRRPGRLLDIGCSLGYFVEAALRRGWDAAGVEISPYAALEARAAGLDVRTGALADAHFAGESFDCVTMWDVLEHVTDPVEHMLEVRRILAKDGLVVIGTPDLGHLLFRLERERWRHIKPGEHIFYFRRSSLGRLLSETGFRTLPPPSVLPVLGNAMSLLSRLTQFNDVMTIYGVKNDL
jgi:SAM-dependent methyltransferase